MRESENLGLSSAPSQGLCIPSGILEPVCMLPEAQPQWTQKGGDSIGGWFPAPYVPVLDLSLSEVVS